MGWESFGVVGFDLGPLVQGQMRIAKLEIAYNSLIKVLEVWDGKPTYRKSWAANPPPPLQGQTRIAKVKSAYNSLIIGPRGLGW